MMTITLEQKKVDELVERFYSKLIKDSYYSSMFAEGGVDIELLKSRQRTFIGRLVSQDAPQEENTSQVNERHPFQTTPERAEIWMRTMEETLNEMRLDDSIKDHLLGKIRFLLDKLIK
jgi:truncated hemoglobin YjbI